MALGFGRKKAADANDSATSPDAVSPPANPIVADTVAAPIAAHAPASPPQGETDAFDLDAFSTPLGDSGAGSAFDFPADSDLEPAPLSTSTAADDDADAPDFDKLYAIEQAQAAQNAARTAAPAPFVPPTATIQEPAAPFYEPQVPVEVTEQPKKKLPLVPILGAVAFLALAGGAASYFASQGQPAEEDAPPIAPPRRISPQSPPPAPPQGAPPQAPAQGAPPQAPPRAVAPPTRVTGASPVSPGIAPVSAQTSQLKALWKRGADAKHRGDYAGARRYWNQGLKIQPRNTGFQESLAKLPK